MKSQISLLNKTLLSHFNGTVFWLTIVFMALNVIALPVSIWITTFERSMAPVYQIPENFLYQVAVGQMIIGMIFALFLAMFLLNYLNNESSSDFMHSLPIKRSSMLLHALLVGIGAIIVPLVITALIVLAERMLFIPEIAVVEIFKWLLYAIFVHCVIFAIAIFTGFLVNGLFLHLQMIVLALFLPFALWGLTYFTATVLYDGIPSSFLTYSEPVLNATFPYVAVMQLYEGINITQSIIWGIVGIVLIVLSFLLYSYRRNELVTMNFNFNWLKELLVAITTIVGMLAMGMIVSVLIPVSFVVSIIGFLIGAVASYLIIEMLFQSSVRIQFKWQSVITTLIIIILFWGIFLFSWQKFVNFVPAGEEVESVYISTQFTDYNPEFIASHFEEGYLFNDDERIIQSAIDAHEITIEEKVTPSMHYIDDRGHLEITYKMKDGSFKTREFDTIKVDSDAIKIAGGTYSAEYDMHSDMLANIKENDNYSLSLGQYNVRQDTDLAKQYKDNIATLKTYRPDIVNETGRIDMNAYFSSVEYFEPNYVYGESSIYNQAVLDAEKADYFSFTDLLAIDETSTMYTVELKDEEMDQFFIDYKVMRIFDLKQKYDMQEIYESGNDREDMISHINEGGLAPEGNKLLLYSYMEFNEPILGSSAEADFSILAIQ